MGKPIYGGQGLTGDMPEAGAASLGLVATNDAKMLWCHHSQTSTCLNSLTLICEEPCSWSAAVSSLPAESFLFSFEENLARYFGS